MVIDTNVVLSMFKRGHPHRPIFDAWAAGRLRSAMSTEILLEYEETAIHMKQAAPPGCLERPPERPTPAGY